jgi:MinD-like ATPase involved in chromosome partitioning or flagellar assembly
LPRIIGVISGKGGVGKTTVASNLAIALSNLGQKVVVVDCNITTPHLAHYLGLKNCTATLNDVFMGKTDIIQAITYYRNIAVIPSSQELKDITRVEITNLKRYISKLANDDFDIILLDSAPGLGREAISVLQSCNEMIFVTTPTIPNVSDAIRCAEVASKMQPKKINIVLNMVRRKNYELKINEANNFFSVPLLGSIQFDESIIDSTALGTPILWDKPDSRIGHNFEEIAKNLIGSTGIIGVTEKEKRGIFSKLFGGFKRLFKRKSKKPLIIENTTPPTV